MTKGKPTPPDLKEQAITAVIRTGNKAEAARQTGLPESTVHQIVQTTEEFEELRLQAQREYISKTWENILAIETALRRKIETTDLSRLQLTDLTRSLKDLKSTVENVVQNIHIGDNVQNNYSLSDARETAYQLIADDLKNGRVDRTQVLTRLGIE